MFGLVIGIMLLYWPKARWPMSKLDKKISRRRKSVSTSKLIDVRKNCVLNITH